MDAAPVPELQARREASASVHGERMESLILCALHALDSEAESEVRGHVRVCRACRREFTQWVGAVGHLALLAPPVAPPMDVRRRLLAAAGQVPREAGGTPLEGTVASEGGGGEPRVHLLRALEGRPG